MQNPLLAVGDAQGLAHAIVDTIHEPFLVLDDAFRVLAASRSFYETFKVDPKQTQGCMLYDLGDGQWDIPALRVLLETVIPEKVAMDDFQVDHDFPGLGRRIMVLNARKVLYETSAVATILLAFTDVTERRAIEREKDLLLARTEDLLRQKQVLLQEMEHRVANSLQIIASILLLKARSVNSDETSYHLRDAHQRVMSVAAVQRYLDMTDGIDQIEVGNYLAKLCGSLAESMIGESSPATINVHADAGSIVSADAVSLGLIVTELVINALKYAFPNAGGHNLITVGYHIADSLRTLGVADNGVGRKKDAQPKAGGGLGTNIVAALARSLDATVEMASAAPGFAVTISQQGPKRAAQPLAA